MADFVSLCGNIRHAEGVVPHCLAVHDFEGQKQINGSRCSWEPNDKLQLQEF